MNIYATSNNPKACARYLDDRRVVATITDTIQLLSNALYLNRKFPKELRTKIYTPQWADNPCSVWTRHSRANYLWLVDHLEELKTIHRSLLKDQSFKSLEDRIELFRKNAEYLDVGSGLTKHKNQAYSRSHGIYYDHLEDVYLAYRLYLKRRWADDKRTPTWTGREKPSMEIG